jgi:hypothetical protein
MSFNRHPADGAPRPHLRPSAFGRAWLGGGCGRRTKPHPPTVQHQARATCYTLHVLRATCYMGFVICLLLTSQQPTTSRQDSMATPGNFGFRGGGAQQARDRFFFWASWNGTDCQAIGPGGLQSGFSTLRYARRDFRKKKTGPRGLPAPPGGPPVLGSLVWRAEAGLPSTRNWPFRWPLSPTSPPQVIPKAM